MKYWNNIVIEGICFGREDKQGNNPCGRKYPTPFCLTNGGCPHFMWSESTERDAAFFVPLRQILWDKLKVVAHNVRQFFEWNFHDRWVNDKELEKFINSIEIVSDDHPSMKEWNEAQEKANRDFVKWFRKARKEW